MSRRLNMLLANLILLPLLFSCGTASAPAARPSVLLVIIDTLRADHLSCYGYRRNTSPAIDSIAAAGARWSRGRGQASWTLPACATIMTGLTPRVHGAGMDVPTGSVYGMDPNIPTIATHLKSAGYRTAAFFNVDLLDAPFGFHRGFDSFSCREIGHGMAGETVDQALDWLGTVEPGEDYFLALHLFDPHDPYDPPAPFDTLFTPGGVMGDSCWEITPEGALADPTQLDHLRSLYDAEIAWTDSQLERLFEGLRELGLDSSTVIVITSDHGEEFLEHGYFGHGRTLYQEILHVPLIISGPGVPVDSVIPSPAGHVDILPTILRICGEPIPEGVDGMHLLGEGDGDRMLPASGINTGSDFELASVTGPELKLIWNAATDSAETYDLTDDPGEMLPLPADPVLLEEVLYYWAAPSEWEPVLLEDWSVAPVLRDLGYIK